MSGHHPALPDGNQVNIDLLLAIHPHKREEYDPLQVMRINEYSVRQHAAIAAGGSPVPEPSAMIGIVLGAVVFAKRLIRRRV